MTLMGEHDLATSSRLLEQLLSLVEEGKSLVIDVAHAGFMDLSVLHALEQARDAAQRAGQRFVLAWGTAIAVELVFDGTGAGSRFVRRQTREDAIMTASRDRRTN